MSRSQQMFAIAVSALALVASPGVAVDAVRSTVLYETPIAASRLAYRDRGTSEKSVLTFVSTDPNMRAPAPGVPPQSGVSIYISTRIETLQLRIPGGLGSPGWRVRHGSRTTYVYRGSSTDNTDAVKLVWREGGPLKLRVRGMRLGNAPPYEGMAIRVESQGMSNCAVFTGSAIRYNRQGAFSGASASSDAVEDCEEATLENALIECGLSAPQCGGYCPDGGECGGYAWNRCVCVSPHQPCGDSWPACNGECALGEKCFTVNEDSFLDCVCAPIDERPCGGGGSYCPTGSSCQYVPYRFGIGSLLCIDDDAVCGQPGFGSCPAGLQCGPFGVPGHDITWVCQ